MGLLRKYSYQGKQYMVMNKSATKNEYNVAQALDHLEIEFLFQVSYWGGRVLGGQVLDFLCFLPFPTPVQVYGNYWHSGQLSNKDRYNEIQIASVFGIAPIIIWGNESETVEDAISTVKRKLMS